MSIFYMKIDTLDKKIILMPSSSEMILPRAIQNHTNYIFTAGFAILGIFPHVIFDASVSYEN